MTQVCDLPHAERKFYLPAVKADLLSRLGRISAAADAYRQAFALATNETERAFLRAQVKQ